MKGQKRMKRESFYISDLDGARIEINAVIPPDPICCIVVWPCSMCSFRIYRMPAERFASSGIGVLEFNPRAHGGSGGDFDYHASFADLQAICNKFFISGVPVVCLGHSGGAGALLRVGESICCQRYWLVSPVLDSRESLFYMYENSSIDEFTGLIAALAREPGLVIDTLGTPEWLDEKFWTDNDLRARLDGISGQTNVGSLLEALFIPGFNVFDDFEKASGGIEIIYPARDEWYPEETVMRLASMHDVPVIRDLGGKDHYFTGAWKNVWAYLENRLVSLFTR